MKLVFSFGTPLIFLNLIFLVLLIRVREPFFVKCVNFLWILLLFFMPVSIGSVFYLSNIAQISKSYCTVFS